MLKSSSSDGIRSDEAAIISRDVQIEGKVSSAGNIIVDGSVKGDIICQKNIQIGEGGQVNGHVSGNNITIGGNIIGTVNARENITLQSKGNIKGDISTKTLVVEAGAKFNGNTKMGNSQDFSIKEKAGKDAPVIVESGQPTV